MGEQQAATPQEPAIEIRAAGLLEMRGGSAFIVGEHGPGIAKVDRDLLGRDVADHRLDLGQPLPRQRVAVGVRCSLREVADGHAGEMQTVGRITQKGSCSASWSGSA